MKTRNLDGDTLKFDVSMYSNEFSPGTCVAIHISAGGFRVNTLLSVEEAQQLGKEIAKACLEAQLRAMSEVEA